MTSGGVPILPWPSCAIWQLSVFISKIIGRLVGVLSRLVLCSPGPLISLTVVGAVVGIPLTILGMLLMSRGLF